MDTQVPSIFKPWRRWKSGPSSSSRFEKHTSNKDSLGSMQEDAQGSHGGKHNMIKIDQNFSTLDASIGAIRRTPTPVHNRAVVDGCGWCPHMRAVGRHPSTIAFLSWCAVSSCYELNYPFRSNFLWVSFPLKPSSPPPGVPTSNHQSPAAQTRATRGRSIGLASTWTAARRRPAGTAVALQGPRGAPWGPSRCCRATAGRAMAWRVEDGMWRKGGSASVCL